MAWVAVDEGFPEHPKVHPLEEDPRLWADCLALWLAGACFSRRAKTDGFIPRERVGRLTPMKKARAYECADALCDLAQDDKGGSLWVRVDGGYRLHDFRRYNPTAAELEEKRQQNARRQAKHREKHKSASNTQSNISRNALLTPPQSHTHITAAAQQSDHALGSPEAQQILAELQRHALIAAKVPDLPGLAEALEGIRLAKGGYPIRKCIDAIRARALTVAAQNASTDGGLLGPQIATRLTFAVRDPDGQDVADAPTDGEVRASTDADVAAWRARAGGSS